MPTNVTQMRSTNFVMRLQIDEKHAIEVKVSGTGLKYDAKTGAILGGTVATIELSDLVKVGRSFVAEETRKLGGLDIPAGKLADFVGDKFWNAVEMVKDAFDKFAHIHDAVNFSYFSADKNVAYGTDYNDKLVGLGNVDYMLGHAGNDKIDGGNGDDDIDGGAGNDVLGGGSGNDVIKGDAGNDRLSGANGDDSLSGGDGNDALAGGNGNDLLDGGKGNDALSGGGGNDLMIDTSGNNSFSGGVGADAMRGGAGNDKMSGSAGKDVLYGAGGTDTYTGGSDADVFVFNAKDATTITITDFNRMDSLVNLAAGDATEAFKMFLENADQVGRNVVYHMDDATIILKNFDIRALTENNFLTADIVKEAGLLF